MWRRSATRLEASGRKKRNDAHFKISPARTGATPQYRAGPPSAALQCTARGPRRQPVVPRPPTRIAPDRAASPVGRRRAGSDGRCRSGRAIDPHSNILEQAAERHANFPVGDSKIAFADAQFARPTPTSPSMRRWRSSTNFSVSGSRRRFSAQSCARKMFSCSAAFRSDRNAICAGIRSRISSIVNGVAAASAVSKRSVNPQSQKRRGLVSRTISSRFASAFLAFTFWFSSSIDCSTGSRRRRKNTRALSRTIFSSGLLGISA